MIFNRRIYMLEIKQIFEKEKYIDLVLEADPDKEIVEKYPFPEDSEQTGQNRFDLIDLDEHGRLM